MFDQTIQETAHWAVSVQPGDVVLFKFPVRQAGDGDSPKIRPCLVLEVHNHFGQTRLTLAFGTSVPESKNRGYEIPVTHPDDVRAAGLKRATRFVGARLISVAPTNPGFEVGGTTGSPIIGRLPANRLDRMNDVRARLHAEHDLAAERRRRRHREAPTVERRRRKILAHQPSSAA